MKTYAFGLTSLALLCVAACNGLRTSRATQPSITQQNAISDSGKGLSDEDTQKYYRTFGTVSWEVREKRTLVEAKIETTRVQLGDLPEGFPFPAY